MSLQPVYLGAVCTAVLLASVHAFLPTVRLSGAAARLPLKSDYGCSVSGLQPTGCRGNRVGVTSSGGRTGATMSGGGEHDLYVVGAGYLGKMIGALWRAKHPTAKMYGETRSYTRHQGFMPKGMKHLMRKNRAEEGARCPNLVFCANPAGNDDYAREVFTAMEEMWDGTGMFVFTSSGSVYAEKDGGVVNEESPIAESAEKSPLRTAERVCLDGGGCVVRLAGLYSVERGPHSVWLEEKRLNSNSQGMINLISYEDAAAAVVAALDAGLKEKERSRDADDDGPAIKGRVFLAADGVPTTRRKICELAMSHPRHRRKTMPKFLLDESPADFAAAGALKVYDNSVTRRDLGWEPRYASMTEYFRQKVEAEEKSEEERVTESAA